MAGDIRQGIFGRCTAGYIRQCILQQEILWAGYITAVILRQDIFQHVGNGYGNISTPVRRKTPFDYRDRKFWAR